MLGSLGGGGGFDDDDAEAGALGVERSDGEVIHVWLLLREERGKCLLFLSEKAFQFFPTKLKCFGV